jgi:hypothetical protein
MPTINLIGSGRLIREPEEVRSRWKDSFNAYFPTESDRVNACFIEVNAAQLALWIRNVTPEPFGLEPTILERDKRGSWNIADRRSFNKNSERIHLRKWMAAVLAIFTIGNGLAMLFASSFWWAITPGVQDTGPINPHFVQDVGAAFVASGAALAARAWQPAYWPAAVAGAAFLIIHASIHLVLMIAGHDQHAAADLAMVVLPAGLALYSAFPSPGEANA